MDENAGPTGPYQLPVPPPAPPPQGWSTVQAPPPQQWGGQWNAVPAPPMTRAQKRRMWDAVSMGFGGGAVYFGIGGLLCAGLALLLYRAPITSTHTGASAAVDHAVGRFILDLFAVMFAMGGVAGGAVGGLAGLVGLVTRRVSLAALSIAGLAIAAGGFALGWYVLVQITSWHF